MISEEEFSTLSEPTQEELLSLFKKSFVLRNEGPTAKAADVYKAWSADLDAKHKKQINWDARLSDARIAKASKSYQEYHDDLLKLQAELPTLLKDEIISPEAISLEMAIGFISGLNPDSIKVLSKLVAYGSATREGLKELLKSAGKINGTVGSINRRFAKRFDKNIYGLKADRVKLIEFDETYRLTCDYASISLAISIIEKGYKIGKGDIELQWNGSPTSLDEPQSERPDFYMVKIDEEAIIFADKGLGFVRFVMWDDGYENESTHFSYRVVVTAPSATVLVNARDEFTWSNDEGGHIWDHGQHDIGSPDTIRFGNKTYLIKGLGMEIILGADNDK